MSDLRRVKFCFQSISFVSLFGKNVGRVLFDRRTHTEPKTIMSHPYVFFGIVQCGFVNSKIKNSNKMSRKNSFLSEIKMPLSLTLT